MTPLCPLPNVEIGGQSPVLGFNLIKCCNGYLWGMPPRNTSLNISLRVEPIYIIPSLYPPVTNKNDGPGWRSALSCILFKNRGRYMGLKLGISRAEPPLTSGIENLGPILVKATWVANFDYIRNDIWTGVPLWSGPDPYSSRETGQLYGLQQLAPTICTDF